jgi:hypothetical protein
MVNPDDYYYKLKEPCSLINRVREHIPKALWMWIPFMHVDANFPTDIFYKDDFLTSIPKNFIPTIHFYKIPKQTVYHWHIDRALSSSINMVLEDYHSHTLFVTGDYTKESKMVSNIIELKYEPETWYLFNSKRLHSVFNLDDRDRYLLTVTFQVPYSEVLAWYKNEDK